MEIEQDNPIEQIIKICGRDPDKRIDILRKCLLEARTEVRIREQKIKEKDEEIFKRVEARRLREEERQRIHGYKKVRFKKPLLALEDRRQYVRCCKKCGDYYRTFAKYGMVCDGCKTSGVSDGVPHDLHSTKYKRNKNE